MRPPDSECDLAELKRRYPDLSVAANEARLIELARGGSEAAMKYLKDGIDELSVDGIRFACPPNSGAKNETTIVTLFQMGVANAAPVLQEWTELSLHSLNTAYPNNDANREVMITLMQAGFAHAQEYLCQPGVVAELPEEQLAQVLDVKKPDDCLHLMMLADAGNTVANSLLEEHMTTLMHKPMFRTFMLALNSQHDDSYTRAIAQIETLSAGPAALDDIASMEALPDPTLISGLTFMLFQHALNQPNIDKQVAVLKHFFKSDIELKHHNPYNKKLANHAYRCLNAGQLPCEKEQIPAVLNLIFNHSTYGDRAEVCIQMLLDRLDPTADAELCRTCQAIIDPVVTTIFRGHADAQHAAAKFHQQLLGCTIYKSPAKTYLKNAAKHGSVESLCTLYPGVVNSNAGLFELAKSGFNSAVVMLEAKVNSTTAEGRHAKRLVAQCYHEGYGVKANPTHARLLLRRLSVISAGTIDRDARVASIDAERADSPLSMMFRSRPATSHAEEIDFFRKQIFFHLQNIGVKKGATISLEEKVEAIERFEKDEAPEMYTDIFNVFVENADDCPEFSKIECERMADNFNKDAELQRRPGMRMQSPLQRVRAGEVVSIDSGWSDGGGHAVRFSFKMIGDDVYMAYGNRGDRPDDEPAGLKFFKVNNYALLDSTEAITRLKGITADRDYIEAQDPGTPGGLGEEWMLEPVGLIGKGDQKSEKCTMASADFAILANMMFTKLEQRVARGGDGAGGPAEIDQAALREVYEECKPAYKFCRQQLKLGSIQAMVDLGKPSTSGTGRLPAAQHQTVLRHMLTSIEGIGKKESYDDMERTRMQYELIGPIAKFLQSPACSGADYHGKDAMLERIRMIAPDLVHDDMPGAIPNT